MISVVCWGQHKTDRLPAFTQCKEKATIQYTIQYNTQFVQEKYCTSSTSRALCNQNESQ